MKQIRSEPAARKVRAHWLSLGTGILLVLSFPSPGLDPLSWVALVPLLTAIRNTTPRRAWLLGWESGIVFNLGLLYWVVVAVHVYGKVPMAVSLIPLGMLVAYLACFLGVFAWSVRLVERRTSIPLGLAIPVLWVAVEYVRSFLFTGFPWENLGYSQYRRLSLIQVSEWTGVYGVSFLIAGANAVCWEGIRCLRREITRRIFFLEAVSILLIAGAFVGYGAVRLDQLGRNQEREKEIRVALIQGSINQDQKWMPEYQDATLEIYFQLSREAAAEGAELIVWPETATPFYFERSLRYRPRIEAFVVETGVPLLFGSPGIDLPRRPGEGIIKHYNSAFLLTSEGQLSGRYDKVHLVPFSEYYPLGRFLRFLERHIQGMGSFTPGSEVKNLRWGDEEIGVLICYEAIFPDLVRRFAAGGADFLVNITNDAWFGRTSAPFQHHSMVVFRAIENRTPIARAANTGVSSFITVTGAIEKKTPIFQREFLLGRLEIRSLRENTFYTRYGDLFAQVVTGMALLVMLFACMREGGRRDVSRT